MAAQHRRYCLNLPGTVLTWSNWGLELNTKNSTTCGFWCRFYRNPKLYVRLLVSPDDRTFADKMKQLDAEGLHEEKIKAEPALKDSSVLIDMGLGDIIFKLDSRKVDGRRKVQRMSYDDVKHVEIWALVSADI